MYPVYFVSKSPKSLKTLNVTFPPVRFSQFSFAVLNVPVSSNEPERVTTVSVMPLKFSAAPEAAADAALEATLGAALAAPLAAAADEAGAADGGAAALAAGLLLELLQAARNAAASGAVTPTLRSCRRVSCSPAGPSAVPS
jgi:hypothetical protein